jgi:NADH:ubiquinone oxidoreductase subunit K
MMTLTLPHFLVLGAILFAIGVFGIFKPTQFNCVVDVG